MARGNNQKPTNDSGLNFEAQLWTAAEQAVPAAHLIMTEYNGARPEGLCLGLIFLKYISDAFEQNRDFSLSASNGDLSRLGGGERNSAKPKARCGPSERARASHWAGVRCRFLSVPPEARWHTIKAKSPEIGKVIDDAMGAVERENPTLKGVLARDYARPSLDTATRESANRICEAHWRDFRGTKDHVRLDGLVDVISNIGFNESAAKSKDVLGRVYEHFLGKFASAEGTLQSAKMICSNRRMKWGFSLSASNGERLGVRCRNPGMNRRGVQNFRGQRWPCASTTTWKLARMNLAIRGIDANLGPRNAVLN